MLQMGCKLMWLHLWPQLESQRAAAKSTYHANSSSTSCSILSIIYYSKKSRNNSYCGCYYSLMFGMVMMLVGGSLRESGHCAHGYGSVTWGKINATRQNFNTTPPCQINAEFYKRYLKMCAEVQIWQSRKGARLLGCCVLDVAWLKLPATLAALHTPYATYRKSTTLLALQKISLIAAVP